MKYIFILIIIFNVKCIAQAPKTSINEKKPVHYIKINHGYSFNIVGSWKEVDKTTLSAKIKIDRNASGKNLNYDYIFSESRNNITYPFIIVSPLYGGRNYFEDFKKDYVSKFGPTVIKYADTISKKASEVNFDENTIFIDEKNKSITSTTNIVTNDNEEITSLTYLCFNNKYTIQFIFWSETKDFTLFYVTYFDEIINSIKTFNINK